jgi:hypothetical protein
MHCERCQGKGTVKELAEQLVVWYSTDGKVYTETVTICPACDGRET